MSHPLTDEQVEDAYAAGADCVRGLAEYGRCGAVLVRLRRADGTYGPALEADVRRLDEAAARLREAAATLNTKLSRNRRAFKVVSRGKVVALKEKAATHIECVLKAAQHYGNQPAWLGRLDLNDESQMRWVTVHDAETLPDGTRVLKLSIDVEDHLAELDSEASRLIKGITGEFDHVLRTLTGQPYKLLALLAENRGNVVPCERIYKAIVKSRIRYPDDSQMRSAVDTARNRLKNALLPDFVKVDGMIKTVGEGLRIA
jgi:hypothetical protein